MLKEIQGDKALGQDALLSFEVAKCITNTCHLNTHAFGFISLASLCQPHNFTFFFHYTESDFHRVSQKKKKTINQKQ